MERRDAEFNDFFKKKFVSHHFCRYFQFLANTIELYRLTQLRLSKRFNIYVKPKDRNTTLLFFFFYLNVQRLNVRHSEVVLVWKHPDIATFTQPMACVWDKIIYLSNQWFGDF